MRILVTGGSGQLGPYVIDELARRGHDVVAWSGRAHGEVGGVALRPIDLTDGDAVIGAFDDAGPDAVIHAAAMARPADAVKDVARAMHVNADATGLLARLAAERGARFVFTSTDMVFDGDAAPYAEDAATNPQTAYGRTKVAGERHVLDSGGVVVRVSLMFGPSRMGAGSGFFDQQVAALRQRRPLRLFDDEYRTPLALCVAAAGLAAACTGEAAGLFHLGGPERMNRVEFARRLAAYLGVADPPYETCSRLSIGGGPGAEPRPADVSLDSGKFYATFPGATRWTMERALDRMMQQIPLSREGGTPGD